MDDQTGQFDDRYMELLEAARDHWWVRGMQEIGATLIEPVDQPLDVLDAGCGTGALLPWAASLTAPSLPFAIDVSPAAVERCRSAGLPAEFEVASVTDLPYDDGRFDLILSSDVLQHLTIDQASAALVETARVLRPGGRLLIRTNSAQGRRHVAERDDWRMYTQASLRSALEDAGLEVDRLTPVNMIQGAWASLPRRTAHDHHDHETLVDEHRAHHGLGIPEPVGDRRNRVFLSLLRWEARYLRKPGRSLPFGHSLYAVARRR